MALAKRLLAPDTRLSQGSGNGQFERPTDMAFDADGNLYVVDFGNDRIQKFEPVR